MLSVVWVSAWPWPSATTWLSAKAIPPRPVLEARWICETWDELAWRPVILSSRLVVFGPAVNVIVPFEVTDASAGFSLKVKAFPGAAEVLGEADGLGGVGEAVEACSPPHAATQSRIVASASQHRVLGIPQQVTGAGREFDLSGPLRVDSIRRGARQAEFGAECARNRSRGGAGPPAVRPRRGR